MWVVCLTMHLFQTVEALGNFGSDESSGAVKKGECATTALEVRTSESSHLPGAV